MKKRTPRTAADLIGELPAKRGRPVEAHRVALAESQTALNNLKAAKMRAELVAAVDVKAEWESALADLRAALLALPSRIGGKFALDRATVAGIDVEIRTMLRALAASGGRSHE